MRIVKINPLLLHSLTPLERVDVGTAEVIAVRMPNWLGDACMALPSIKQLKQKFKKVVAVVPPQLAEFAYAVTEIDQVIVLSSAHKRWSSSDIKNLRDVQAECALLFNNSLRDAWYFFRAGIPLRYGAKARCRSLLLTRSFLIPHVKMGELNNLHHARKYSAMAEAVSGIPWDGKFPDIRGKKPQKNDFKTLLLAPGAAYGAAKRWPSDMFNALAIKFLAKHADGRIVIVGGKSECKIAEEVARDIPLKQVTNLCGKTSFDELTTALKSADVCAANDSGVMHLAAALGTPGVAMFGPTDCSSTSPIYEKWVIIYSEFPCSPCFKRKCPHSIEPACMRNISENLVLKQVEALLEKEY